VPPDAFNRRHGFGGSIKAGSHGKIHCRRDAHAALTQQAQIFSGIIRAREPDEAREWFSLVNRSLWQTPAHVRQKASDGSREQSTA